LGKADKSVTSNVAGLSLFNKHLTYTRTFPVTVRSEAWVCGSSLAGVSGLNPTGMSIVSVACCQVEVSATG